MSLFTPSTQRLEITAARIALLEQGRRGWEKIAEFNIAPGSRMLELLPDRMQELESTIRRSPLSIVVPDSWCKLFLTNPPSNASSLQDLRDAAAMRLRAVYDVDPQAYYIQFDLSPTTPFFCCAMERPLVDRMRELGKASRARIESIRPQYVESAAGWNPTDSSAHQWLLSCDDELVTIGMFSARICIGIVQTRWADTDWSQAEQIGIAALREALRADIERPSTITLTGPPVGAWQRQRAHEIELVPIDQNTRRYFGKVQRIAPLSTSRAGA